MLIGYARVSTKDQSVEMQTDALSKAGCERIYEEVISGSFKDRPKFELLMSFMRKGDTLVIWKLDRLSRSVKDLLSIFTLLKEKEIQIISLTEHIDTTTAMGNLIFHVMASLSQFERDVISERTKTALAIAKERGIKAGRKRIVSDDKIKMAKILLADKTLSVKKVSEMIQVSVASIYRYIPNAKNTGT